MIVYKIVQKELYKIWGNKRTLFTTVFLPGIVIFFMYSLMGYMINHSENSSIDTINVINNSKCIDEYLKENNIIINSYKIDSKSAILKDIENCDKNILVVLPQDFDDEIQRKENIPNIEIYFNSANQKSIQAYQLLVMKLNEFEANQNNIFNINIDGATYDLAFNKKGYINQVAFLMPMLLIGLIFSSGMSISAEAIAGEKEHGTMNTLLVTPIRRFDIAIAKVCALSIISFISAISSFLGIIFSIPTLLHIGVLEIFTIYNLESQIIILIILLSSVIFMVSVMSVASALAKTTKEAITFISPFTVVATITGMICLTQAHPDNRIPMYLIPFYNTAQSLFATFKLEIKIEEVIVTIITNLIYSTVCIVALSKIFNEEKIMVI